jgi:hypothetical protein
MITIIKDKKFTGTQYTKEQFSQDVQEFHKNDLWIDKPIFDIAFSEGEEPDYGKPTAEEMQIAIKTKFTRVIQSHIDNAIQAFNNTHGVAFESLANIDSAGNRTGYSLQAECKAFADWAYITVWDTMREWEQTLTDIPTDEEFQAKLGTLAYQG